MVCDDNALVDRAAAVRAGLGWYGKNALVLLPGRGSWFVLGSVVTDAPLLADGPPLEPAGGCGSCVRCLSACPTGAIVAPGVIDARRCLAWLLEAPGSFPSEYRAALGNRLYGCDECQSSCPVNRRAERGSPPPPPSPDDEGTVDVVAMLAMTDDELLTRFGRWYVPRRRARFLRRNALVVLGNVGDGGSPPVVAALERALADADPLVRSHAVWAAAQLGRTDLVAQSRGREQDPDVLAELDAAGLTGSGLTGAGITGAGITGAGLTGSGLTGSGFPGSGFPGSGFPGAGITGAGPAPSRTSGELAGVER